MAVSSLTPMVGKGPSLTLRLGLRALKPARLAASRFSRVEVLYLGLRTQTPKALHLLHFYTAILNLPNRLNLLNPLNLLNLLLHFFTAKNIRGQTCWLRSAEHEAKW